MSELPDERPDQWGLKYGDWASKAAIGGGQPASEPVPVPAVEIPPPPSNAGAVPGPSAIGGKPTGARGIK